MQPVAAAFFNVLHLCSMWEARLILVVIAIACIIWAGRSTASSPSTSVVRFFLRPGVVYVVAVGLLIIPLAIYRQ